MSGSPGQRPEALQIQKTTAVRLRAPFSDKDLANFLGAIGDEFPKGVVINAEVWWPDNGPNREATEIILVATETTESGYHPKPEAG